MSEDDRYAREAAVYCDPYADDYRHPNCRHAWNAEHPEDPVTLEEQVAVRDELNASLARADACLHTDLVPETFLSWPNAQRCLGCGWVLTGVPS